MVQAQASLDRTARESLATQAYPPASAFCIARFEIEMALQIAGAQSGPDPILYAAAGPAAASILIAKGANRMKIRMTIAPVRTVEAEDHAR